MLSTEFVALHKYCKLKLITVEHGSAVMANDKYEFIRQKPLFPGQKKTTAFAND